MSFDAFKDFSMAGHNVIITGGAQNIGAGIAKTLSEVLPLFGNELVGVVSQADIARNYPEDRVGELVAFISY